MQRNRIAPKSFALAAALTSCMALAGCSAINPQETQSITAAVPGVQAAVGPLEANNLAIVSSGNAGTGTPTPDAPGRLTGGLYNTSSSPVTATLSTQTSNAVDVTVPPNGEVLLGEDRSLSDLTRTGAVPGAMTKVTIQTGSSTQDVLVPVLDGTLAQYRQYLPTPSGTASTPSPTASTPRSTASPSSGMVAPAPTTTPSLTTTPSASPTR